MWEKGKDDAWYGIGHFGHEGIVNSAAFDLASPLDGARFVTVSENGTARVWDLGKTGLWTRVALEGHTGSINSAVFSPDGSRIATASQDKTAQVWSQDEAGSWTSIALEGHQGSVNSADFSPDGTRIVTASDDRTARVWDVRWLMGPGDWAKAEPLSLPETVCREKFRVSWITVQDPKTRIAERLLTADDIKVAPILAGREGEDVCAPFLEPRRWWSRLAFWR